MRTPLLRRCTAALLASFLIGLIGKSPAETAELVAHGQHHQASPSPRHDHQTSDTKGSDTHEKQRCPGICFCKVKCSAGDFSPAPFIRSIVVFFPAVLPRTNRPATGRLAVLLPFSTGPPLSV
jgi:hypothetical protein